MKLQNFINGSFVNPDDNEFIANYCPATGNEYGKVPDSKASDVEKAVEAAQTAFPSWSKMPPIERSKVNYLKF